MQNENTVNERISQHKGRKERNGKAFASNKEANTVKSKNDPYIDVPIKSAHRQKAIVPRSKEKEKAV